MGRGWDQAKLAAMDNEKQEPKIITREQKAQYAQQVADEYQEELESGGDLG